MSQIFTYKDQTFASVPALPIKAGSQVLVVFKTVGFMHNAQRFHRRVGSVTHVIYPATFDHHICSFQHSPNYRIPAPYSPFLHIMFDDGQADHFAVNDVVHVTRLFYDTFPTVEELFMFDIL